MQVDFTTGKSNYVVIVNTCTVCKDEVEILIDRSKYNRWRIGGEYVQNVFPELSPNDRELLISGTHPECWERLFSDA